MSTSTESTEAGVTVDEVVIGSLHPESGSSAADGQQMARGAQYAVDAINEAGGIESLGGAKLVLSSADTQGKPEVGQSEATRLIQEGAVALIGTYQSATSANVAAVAERSKVPFVMDISSLDEILDQGYTYSFRLQPNATLMGTQGAEALIAMGEASDEPVEKVAFLYEQGNFGQATLKSFQAAAEEAGVTVDPVISYDAASVSDMTTQVQQVAASGADVLAVAGYYRDSLLVSQAVDTIKPDLDAVFGVANGAYDQPQFVTDAPNGGEGYFDANYHWDVTNDAAVELADKYEAEFGEPIRTGAVLSYDAVMVIAAALEESGTVDTTDLRDAIADSSYEPLVVSNGPVSFDEDGENTNASIVVMQVQDGAIKQVYPDDRAESDFLYPAPVN
ncbi:branched-chain amino acid transport system substrate-binding protein [Conyzicola lurida]|uniref:Branched-chain amino acid transport system substrate-binding protein n=1 Tax=Conyzicola lurida TaxID=1172621 RepID=A0A841AT44_9MICO|nr:ABC transporter substrate-binding protein [Conyzicola lurida]MBB5844569.1 branched-chain amino acid transport system substrate-binding protein [Conyzicola lurida]